MTLNQRKKTSTSVEYALFDVVYQDGAVTSNRKVPLAEIEQHSDRDAAAKAFIEAQDRKLAEASGSHRGPIKTIKKSGR